MAIAVHIRRSAFQEPEVHGPDIGGAIVNVAFAAARAVHRRLRYWRDRERLRSFPDHMLRDIGITRADIDRVVMEGSFDPTTARARTR